MNILIEFAILILIASIVVFFSKEFGQWIKKLFAIPGAVLMIPLVFMSWFVVYFQKNIRDILWYLQEKLKLLISDSVLGSSFLWQKEVIISIMILTILSILPVNIINQIYWRRYLSGFEHNYFLSTFIWIIFAALFITK